MKLIVTEKPSVAMTYCHVLGVQGKHDGYIENDEWIITWCIGHLVTMSYPEEYDSKYKEWNLEDLPFIPDEYRYEVIENVKKQFSVIKHLYNRKDIDVLYYAGDSAREGIYIQALVRQEAGHNPKADERVVWIDSQTPAEIARGIRSAKPINDYKNLISSGYQRAIEDYLVGINFSRGLSVKYGGIVCNAMKTRKARISVGRVMTCVLGMVVDKEREVRTFKPTPFYRIFAAIPVQDTSIKAEWHIVQGSKFFNSPKIYDNTGFLDENDAKTFMNTLPATLRLEELDEKEEEKKAPTLFNLAELQSECSRLFKISPDKTLKIVQALYEKKLTTYPRTDARVITSAVAAGIDNNIKGLIKYEDWAKDSANKILSEGWDKSISSYKKYVDDSKVSDHYAIIPTGFIPQQPLLGLEKDIFNLIIRRFLAIFYPPAKYEVVRLKFAGGNEEFCSVHKLLSQDGYYEVSGRPNIKERPEKIAAMIAAVKTLKTGTTYDASYKTIKGETAPPKRYTSGDLILAMENAGKLIEDEDLREQIKKSGIGTSATRAAIIEKLLRLTYLKGEDKTQIITPDRLGYMVYEIVIRTFPDLLKPEVTANWEKGLEQVAAGIIEASIYQEKIENYVRKGVEKLKMADNIQDVADGIKKYAKNKNFEADLEPFQPKTLRVNCPLCGSEIVTTPYGYKCAKYKKDTGCQFAIGTICGVNLTEMDIEELVNKKKTRVLKGFQFKKGSGSAALVADYSSGKMEISFDFSEVRARIIKGGRCPKCRGQVEVYPFGYRCEHNTNDENSTCDFLISKICGKKLSEAQVTQMLTDGQTKSPVKGLTSSEGKKFDAVLKLEKDGKIKFVFPERKPATESAIKCPRCRNNLKKDAYKFACDCGYKIRHIIAKKELSDEQIASLIQNGSSAKISGFISQKGKAFSAVLKVDEYGEIKFDFGE